MIRLTDVFSELNGFVLCVVDQLEVGADLLTRFTTTEEGDDVARRGHAIPVIGVETGEYTLIIREVDQPTKLPTAPRISSPGWVLHVDGELGLCGVGYLATWNPKHPKVHRVTVPHGWYAVIVDVCDWHVEFVLSRCDEPPVFTADLQTDFA
ncbi:MAG: hypothetical protein ACO1OB_30085 [Archangium sp.]